jgi:hypothetical protein
MPVGNQPDAGALNAMLANNASGLRSSCSAIAELWAYVAPLGAEGLTAPPPDGPGMTPAVAADFYDKASRMQAVASVYYGDATQPQPFNYDKELAPVRGGRG